MSAWRLSSLTAIFHQSWRSAASSVASSSVEPFLMLFGAAVASYMWTVVSDAGAHLGGGPVGADAVRLEEPAYA